MLYFIPKTSNIDMVHVLCTYMNFLISVDKTFQINTYMILYQLPTYDNKYCHGC